MWLLSTPLEVHQHLTKVVMGVWPEKGVACETIILKLGVRDSRHTAL